MGKVDPVYIHDLFNIFAVFGIIVLDFRYLYHATEWNKIGTPDLGADHLVMGHTLLSAFSIYMLIDTIWIAVQPKCVLSNPKALIVHHIASFVFLSVPFIEKEFQWHGALTLFVEVNTLLLILRRQFLPSSLMYAILDYSFLATWIFLRLVVFPILVVFFAYEHSRYTIRHNGKWFNIMLLAPILQLILTLLGLKWTYDMLIKMASKAAKIKEASLSQKLD